MNMSGHLQGHTDCPLNEAGESQAREVGVELKRRGIKFERIYSSPLSRALRTAELATGVPESQIIKEPRIIEFSFGQYEGMTYEEMGPKMFEFLSDPDHIDPPEGMEKIQHLMARTGEFLADLAKLDVDGNVLVSSHGVAIRSILANLMDMHSGSHEGVWGKRVENGSLFVTEVHNGEFSEVDELHLL